MKNRDWVFNDLAAAFVYGELQLAVLRRIGPLYACASGVALRPSGKTRPEANTAVPPVGKKRVATFAAT